jgi:hypothetical protein
MRRTALRAGLAAGCLLAALGAGTGPHALAQDSKPASDAAPSPTAGDNNAAAKPAAPATPPPAAAAPPAAAPPAPAPPESSPQATQAPSTEAAPPSTPPAQPATPPEKPPENTSPPPAAPPQPVLPVASVLDKRLIIGVLGKDVKSPKGEDMGRIVDVIVDRSGQTRAAIIDFGGFLGVGSRRIAVDWNALHFEPQQKGDQIALDLTRDQVKMAPEYKEDKPVVVLGPSGAAEPIPDN